MRDLRVAPASSHLEVSTPRDVASKDHGHGVVGLPPVLSARLVGPARDQAWPWVTCRPKTSAVAGAVFTRPARA